MGKGRPRRVGKRRPDGRLAPLVDRGNDAVQARREAFRVFQGGKADQQLFDPIGRAWAVGLLDGQAHDAALLRDAGRRYAVLYWGYWGGGPSMADPDGGSGRSVGSSDDDPRGELFNRLDRLALDAGRRSYDELHQFVVNGYWFPENDPAWLARLLRVARLKGATAPIVSNPVSEDQKRLLGAVRCLVAIVEG